MFNWIELNKLDCVDRMNSHSITRKVASKLGKTRQQINAHTFTSAMEKPHSMGSFDHKHSKLNFPIYPNYSHFRLDKCYNTYQMSAVPTQTHTHTCNEKSA